MAGNGPQAVTIFHRTTRHDVMAAAELAVGLAAALGPRARVRCVATGDAIGRDVLESDRIVLLGWRVPPALPHLRELLLQHRGRATVVLEGTTDERDESEMVLQLRRFAGRVLATDTAQAQDLRQRLLVPVAAATATELPTALAAALAEPAQPLDDVALHLAHARTWLQRCDFDGAFAAAGRALKLAPDSPELIANVALILAGLGRVQQAETLCRAYLTQRPGTAVVDAALQRLLAVPTCA